MQCRLCLVEKTSDRSWEPTRYLSKNTFEFSVKNSNSSVNHWFPDQETAFQFLVEKQIDGKAAILFEDGTLTRCDREGYVPSTLEFPVEVGDFYIERHCPESGHNKEQGSFGPYEVIRWDTADWGEYNSLREPGFGNHRLGFPTFDEAWETVQMLPKCEYGWSIWVCGPNTRRRVYGETCFDHLHWTEVPYKTAEKRQRILSQLEERPYYLKNMPRHVSYWRELDSRVIAWFDANKHREYQDLKADENCDLDKYTGDEIDTDQWLNNWVCDATPLYKFITEGKLDPANALQKVGDSIKFTDGEFSSKVRLVRDTLSEEILETLEDAYEFLGYSIDEVEDDMDDEDREEIERRANRLLDRTLTLAELEYTAQSNGIEMDNFYAESCIWDSENLTDPENEEVVSNAWDIFYRCTKESLWMLKTNKSS